MNKKNSKKKNNIIRKFEQPIFIPKILYVCKYCTKEFMDKHFEFSDHTSIVEDSDNYSATTSYGVRDKTTDKLCIVVQLNKSLIDNVKSNTEEIWSTCAHEAFHVADEILKQCDTTLTDSNKETYAYMVGWAAVCIFKTVYDVK